MKRSFRVTDFALLFALACSVAEAGQPDFATIQRYGLLASAAYGGREKARAACESQGYRFNDYATAGGVEVSYFLCTDEAHKSQIIAVRGTANAENVMVDTDFKLMPDKHTGEYIHSGFSQSATAVYNTIKPLLQRDYTINTTGHSLGGAVALVLAMYLEQDEYHVGRVITFGQPKVTNISGAQRYGYMDITRVVTEKDVVPLLPPVDLMDIKSLDIYWHVGQELILLPGVDYSLASGIPSMLRAVKFFQETPGEQNLQQHQMSLYLDLLGKKINTAKEVPYNSGINLLGLF